MCEKPVVMSTLLDIYYRRCLSGSRADPAGRKVNKNLDISHIYVGALENILGDRYSLPPCVERCGP